MKIYLLVSVACCFIGLSITLGVPPTLPEDPSLMEIVSLVPRDLVDRIAHKHLKEDEGFKAAIKYMQGKEWKNLVENIKNKPEWIKLKELLKEVGVDVDKVVHCARAFIDNVTVEGTPTAKPDFKAFLIDVEQVIPAGQIIIALQKKVQTVGFKKGLEVMTSEESKKTIADVLALKEFQKATKVLDGMGLHMTEVISIIANYLGFDDANVTKKP